MCSIPIICHCLTSPPSAKSNVCNVSVYVLPVISRRREVARNKGSRDMEEKRNIVHHLTHLTPVRHQGLRKSHCPLAQTRLGGQTGRMIDTGGEVMAEIPKVQENQHHSRLVKRAPETEDKVSQLP